MPSILFVCMANICRSPMAMGMFMAMVQHEPVPWQVGSAGTWAIEGAPAHPNTIQVLAERGISLEGHRAQSVDNKLLQSFNLILTMEEGQKEALQVEFPDMGEKIFMVTEMVGLSYNIQDPVGGELSDFRITANDFERIFTDGYDRIVQLASA